MERAALVPKGEYILASKSHSVALRRLDGEWQINFGHRRHTWEMAVQAEADAVKNDRIRKELIVADASGERSSLILWDGHAQASLKNDKKMIFVGVRVTSWKGQLSFIHSFLPSFLHSFIHSFIHSFVHSLFGFV